MNGKRLTPALALKIQSLLNGETLASSSMAAWLAAELKEEGLLVARTHGSRCSYRVSDPVACEKYILENYTGGLAILDWVQLMMKEKESAERAELVREVCDSKLNSVRTFRGFLVNCYEPVSATLGDQELLLKPQENTAVFIQDPDSFRLPDDVVVVGVENGENFQFIRQQRYLFGEKEVLFVSRYPQSADLRNWLMQIPNKYIHFGDFDLAGIHIYLSEFYKYLGDRASFFIPEDIEQRLMHGNLNLYNRQYAKFHNMRVLDSRLQPLVDMIHKYHRVYEQEGYIQTDRWKEI